MLQKIKDMHGRLDVLVPNAACSTHFGTQLDITESAYDKLWDLNVKSTFFLIKECYPLLLASKEAGGAANVCTISSVTGRIPSPMIGVYSMTKAALDNMTQFLSKELMDDGIRVNAVAPGLIKTDFAGPIHSVEGLPPQSIGQPHHIGSVVATVCSKDDGAFMNGEIYYVNGGFAKL